MIYSSTGAGAGAGAGARAITGRSGELATGQRVSILLDERLLGGAVNSCGERVVVELNRAAPMPLPMRGTLQYLSQQGIMRNHGSLEWSELELARRVTFTPRCAAQLLLCRERLRAEVVIPVDVEREDGSVLRTASIDLSETGALLGVGAPLELGETVTLRLQLSRFEPVVVTSAVVVRFSAPGFAAVHYVEIDAGSLDRLCWLIFHHVLSARGGRH